MVKRRFGRKAPPQPVVERAAQTPVEVPVEDLRSPEPVQELAPEPVPIVLVEKPALVYLTQPALREAWVDILALRVLKQPIPEHLAMNDNLAFTSNTAARRVLEVMMAGRVELDLQSVRHYADRAIPRA